jgi:hypothetical protein
MKLSISCGGTPNHQSEARRCHAICNLINEVQMIPVARVGDPKRCVMAGGARRLGASQVHPASRSKATLFVDGL